mgnify:CR=1 FL=1
MKKLQEENQDLKLQIFQLLEDKKKLQVQFDDIQEDTKKHDLIESRANEEYKDNILKLKEEIEKLHIDNTSLV